MDARTGSRWSLAHAGNRAVLAAALGLIAFWTTRSVALGAVIAALAFGIASVFFARRN
jgi:surface antigen